MTTTCPNCKRYAAIVTEDDGSNWLYDLDTIGHGASDRRHVCGESDRAAY